jgi:hypothetical protein
MRSSSGKNLHRIVNKFLRIQIMSPSESSIKRARKRHGLLGGASNLKTIPQADAEQLVLDQLDLDPAGHAGPRTIRHRIAAREQEHLPRAFVNQVMKTHAPDGFKYCFTG